MTNPLYLACPLNNDLVDRFENGKPPAGKPYHFFCESQTVVLAGMVERTPDFFKTLDFYQISRLKIIINGWRPLLWISQLLGTLNPKQQQNPSTQGDGEEDESIADAQSAIVEVPDIRP